MLTRASSVDLLSYVICLQPKVVSLYYFFYGRSASIQFSQFFNEDIVLSYSFSSFAGCKILGWVFYFQHFEYSVPMPFWCQLILFKFPFVSQFSLTALKVSSFRLSAPWPWCVWIWISLNLYKLRVYGASWVCKLMFTIKSETFSAMISPNTLSPSLSPFLLELPLHLHQYP